MNRFNFDLSYFERFLNPLDIAAAAVILVFMVFAGRRGLIKSLYGLLSFFLAIFLVNLLYPFVASFLRQVPFFQNWGGNTLAAEAFDYTSKSGENLFISSLNLPEFVKFFLIENNNPDTYGLLSASGLGDYIALFLSNMLVNIIAMLLSFIVIYAGLKLIGKLLDVVARLPVISAFNRLGGLVIGFLQGVLALWIAFTVITLFLSRPYFAEFLKLVEMSDMAAVLYENNFILHMAMRIMP